MKSSDNTLLFVGLFVLIVVVIALIVYYTRPGETKTPDQTSDDTVLKVKNLTFERTLNPDPSVGDGVSGYTIEPYGVEYASPGTADYKELSKNVTFTMNWENAPGFNAAVVKGFKIEHFVRKENVTDKPTKVEQTLIKIPVSDTDTDKDNISARDFGKCRAKIVSVGTGPNAYSVIGQNSFKLYAVTKMNDATAVDWNNTDTQKYVLIYDGRDEPDDDTTALKIIKDQLSVTLKMTTSETIEFVPKAPNETSSRTVINKSTYTVSNENNSSTLAGVYLTTVPGTGGKHFYFTFEDGTKHLLNDLTIDTPGATELKKKFIFEIVDRVNTKGKIRKVSTETDESKRQYLSTKEDKSLKLYTQKDSDLTQDIFDRFTWTFTERIAAALTTPPNTTTNNLTGEVVCISGDYALVGQPGYNNNNGRVIEYTRNASGAWKIKKSNSSDRTSEGRFGSSISIDGDYAIIGEPGEGFAYLVKKVDGVWEFSLSAAKNKMLRMVPPSLAAGNRFGESVSISGNFMVIGQPGASKVYLYSRKNMQNYKPITFSMGGFGESVSISGYRFIVGAKSSGGNNAGSAHIYEFTETDNKPTSPIKTQSILGIPWTKSAAATPPLAGLEANLYFGTSVAIQGEFVFVGAPGFNKNNGRVYVYKLGSDGWTRNNSLAYIYYKDKMKKNATNPNDWIGSGNAVTAHDTIEPPQTSNFAGKSTPPIIPDLYFGTSLDISGNKLVIGSAKENKVRIYTQSDKGMWNDRVDKTNNPNKVPVKLIEPPFKQNDSRFGEAVSIDGDNVIIGEPNKKVGNLTGAGASYITTV